jgi:hypothetical protein
MFYGSTHLTLVDVLIQMSKDYKVEEASIEYN